MMNVIIGILIPFLGTTLGASLVFFMKDTIQKRIEKMLLGFASGVMIAASVWSLLIPAIEMSESQGKVAWLAPSIGFLLGTVFLPILNDLFSRLQINCNKLKEKTYTLKKTTILMIAVTLHNIPEGMAVGVVFAGVLAQNTGIALVAAFALAIGIAVQNFPEGAIISMPLRAKGMSKRKSFFYGMMSGIVEPIGAIGTIFLTSCLVPILPYVLAFAAGAMIYVVVVELIPESQAGEDSKGSMIFVAIGFILMMILDVALG